MTCACLQCASLVPGAMPLSYSALHALSKEILISLVLLCYHVSQHRVCGRQWFGSRKSKFSVKNCQFWQSTCVCANACTEEGVLYFLPD